MLPFFKGSWPTTWSELPDNVLGKILEFTQDPCDVAQAAKVCKDWSHIAPWVIKKLLSFCMIEHINGVSVLFNLLTKERRTLNMSGKCLGCSEFWILVVDDVDNMHVLNVVSRNRVHLPLVNFDRIESNWKLTVNEDIVVVHYLGKSINHIWFCKPGNASWIHRQFERYDEALFLFDISLHKGELYEVYQNGGNMVVIGVNLCQWTLQEELETDVIEQIIPPQQCINAYFSKSIYDHLLLVRLVQEDGRNFFEVGLWDDTKRDFFDVEELQGCALVVSINGNHLIAEAGIFKNAVQADCVYQLRQLDYHVYDMVTGQWALLPLSYV